MGIGKHILTLNKHHNILENLIENECLRKNVISFDLNNDKSTVEIGDFDLGRVKQMK